MTLAQRDHYLVLDLEATCRDQEMIQRYQIEIIEIGAVMVDVKIQPYPNEEDYPSFWNRH